MKANCHRAVCTEVAKGIIASIVLLSVTAAPAESPSSNAMSRAEDSAIDARSSSKLDMMIRSNMFTHNQIENARFLFQQQKDRIELFSNYGLLSAQEMQDKILEIREATENEILSLFTEEQKARWSGSGAEIVTGPIRRLEIVREAVMCGEMEANGPEYQSFAPRSIRLDRILRRAIQFEKAEEH